MNNPKNLAYQVFAAARDQGVSSVLFRNAISRKLKLNGTDAECLSLLSIKGVSTPKDLAIHTGLTTGSTTAMLDRLEKIGYIRRVPNPHDRRGILVEITQAYKDAAAPLVAGVQAAHTQLIASYSDDELRVIIDFLTRFTQNVTDQTDKIQNTPKSPDSKQ